MVSKVRQKLNNIELIQRRCYEEFNQFGIELSRESTFEDFHAHVKGSDNQGLSPLHSYDKYLFYTMCQGEETVIVLYVEWKQNGNFDPHLCEWRMNEHYTKTVPKIKTFKQLLKAIKD